VNKGLVYSSFALVAAALIVSLAFLPFSTPEARSPSDSFRIGQASFFLDSVLGDMDRSLQLGSRRALTSSTNYVITENQELVEPSINLSSALVNGTISGKRLENMENVSFQAWENKVENISDNSGYSLNATVTDYSFNSSFMEIHTSYSVFARLKDPVTLASFNRTNSANASVTVEGLEDTMLLLQSKGRYVSKYSECGFSDPIESVATASEYGGSPKHGKISYKPSDLSTVYNPSERILVVVDVDNFAVNDVNDFKAVVSEDDNSTSGYTTTYAFDTGPVLNMEENRTAVVKQGELWREDLTTMFNEKCYIEDNEGPTVIDRFGNNLVSGDDTGVATLIDISELPSQLRKEDSAVGYVYFNESDNYGDIKEISGVSDEYSWFRLDQDHIDEWNANELVK